MTDYEEQLTNALEETPDIEDQHDRFDIPTPIVRQEGHMTVYENFQETVNRLDRDEDLVMKFIQNELGTSAQFDESGRARLTGEFTTRRIGTAIEKFADEYVRCPECGLPDTHLVEQSGAKMLKCDACGALSSVE